MITANPPVTVVCFSTSLITTMVMLVLTPMGQIISGQYDVVLPPQLNMRDTVSSYPGLTLCCSNNHLSPECILRHIPWVLCRYVSPSELSLTLISYVTCWCLLWCLFSAFRFPCGCHVHQMGLNHWCLQHCNPSEFTLGRHMCLLRMVCGPHQKCTERLPLSLL